MSRKLASGNPFATKAVAGVTFGTLTAEAANARTQSLQFTDENGADIVVPVIVDVYLSLASTGIDIVGTAATSLLAGTDGSVLDASVTGKLTKFQTEADGDLDVVITDSAVRTVYLCVVLPDGTIAVSSAIAFA